MGCWDASIRAGRAADQHSSLWPRQFNETSAKQPGSTKALLEQLSILVTEAHGSLYDLAIIREHYSDDFEAANETIHECPMPGTRNLEEHLRNI